MKRFFSFFLIFTLVVGMIQPANAEENQSIIPFEDVKLYQTEISYLIEKQIIQGYEDGTFRPNQPVKRLQAVQMIMNALGVELDNVPDVAYTDLKTGDYGYEYVAKATELGIIKGKTDGSFDPWGYLTRAQMAAILVKAFSLEGQTLQRFADVPEKHWANDVIHTLAANRITKGYENGTYRPEHTISRAHFSVFLAKVLNKNLIPADRGNEPGNIMNSGNFAVEQGWMYFGDYGIYKWKMGENEANSEMIELSPPEQDNVANMNIVGDWIYYVNVLDNYSVYQMKIDGTLRQKVVEGPVLFLTVIDDIAVYTKSDQLYKAHLKDGTETQLTDQQVYTPIVKEDWVYYTDKTDHKLYKIKLDGTSEPRAIVDNVGLFDVSDQYIYYQDFETSHLFRADLDGNMKTQILNEPVYNLNADNGWIYYSNPTDWYIYKTRADGSETMKLSEYTSPGLIMLFSNRLIYTILFDDYTYSWVVSDQDGNTLYEIGPIQLPEELR
ncbi:MAG: DUF5050 domain-containing protein [Bacillaceae bacterium]|nr:DUF5050 domain-containing protein [Bacillaceae bacterium]